MIEKNKKKLIFLFKDCYETGFYNGISDAKYGSACEEFEDWLKRNEKIITELV